MSSRYRGKAIIPTSIVNELRIRHRVARSRRIIGVVRSVREQRVVSLVRNHQRSERPVDSEGIPVNDVVFYRSKRIGAVSINPSKRPGAHYRIAYDRRSDSGYEHPGVSPLYDVVEYGGAVYRRPYRIVPHGGIGVHDPEPLNRYSYAGNVDRIVRGRVGDDRIVRIFSGEDDIGFRNREGGVVRAGRNVYPIPVLRGGQRRSDGKFRLGRIESGIGIESGFRHVNRLIA